MRDFLQLAINAALRLERHIDTCAKCSAAQSCKECRELLLEWQEAAGDAFVDSLPRPPPD